MSEESAILQLGTGVSANLATAVMLETPGSLETQTLKLLIVFSYNPFVPLWGLIIV